MKLIIPKTPKISKFLIVSLLLASALLSLESVTLFAETVSDKNSEPVLTGEKIANVEIVGKAQFDASPAVSGELKSQDESEADFGEEDQIADFGDSNSLTEHEAVFDDPDTGSEQLADFEESEASFEETADFGEVGFGKLTSNYDVLKQDENRGNILFTDKYIPPRHFPERHHRTVEKNHYLRIIPIGLILMFIIPVFKSGCKRH